MDYSTVFMFLCLSFLSGYSCKNATLGTIKRVAANPMHTKKYVSPPQIIKKVFCIKQTAIPRYLCVELFMTIFFALLGPISTIICIVTNFKNQIVGILVVFHASAIIANTIYFSIMSLLFNKSQVSN